MATNEPVPPHDTKYCYKCHTIKPTTEFYSRRRTCKQCYSEKNRQAYNQRHGTGLNVDIGLLHDYTDSESSSINTTPRSPLLTPSNTVITYNTPTFDDIGSSTSAFGKNAEAFLNIHIHETDTFDDIVNNNLTDDDINKELKELLLEEFDRDAIRIYKPKAHISLPKSAQTFLFKLNTVLNNNYQQVEPPHVEEYISDLMDNLLKTAKFEDGTDLILMPSFLRLSIGHKSITAYSDKEGRRGTSIICVYLSDKHRFDKRWKKGDIKLIANMVAAMQTNRSQLNRVYPERILGIKFSADNVYFYSADISHKYLDELASEEKPQTRLIVNKFPKHKVLSLSAYEDRKKIFLYLSALKRYALNLEDVN